MQNMGISVLFKGNNFLRLCQGLWVTLRIALIAMIFSIILGFILGMIMTSKNKVVKLICRIYLEIVRIIRAMDMSIPKLEAFKKKMKNELPGRVEIQKEEIKADDESGKNETEEENKY